MNFFKKIRNLKESIKVVDERLAGKSFIRVEDLRDALQVSTTTAREILKLAELRGVMKSEVKIYSPYTNVIIGTFDSLDDVNNVVFDNEFEEDESYAFIKNIHADSYMEVVYRYV